MEQLSTFGHIQRCLKHWITLNAKYGCGVNKTLLMLGELTLQELRLREQMPMAKDLMMISWAFEGLRKKRYYEELKGNI